MKLFWQETDYNLILEKILDSKYFSSDAKSLLFNMVYKIETFYSDYQVVKKIDKTKEKYLSELLENIKKYCDNIKLIEPDSDDAKILKDNNVLALTNEKERSLLVYPTETSLLYGLSDVIPKYFYIPNSFAYKNAMQESLVNGYNDNNLEILADFNGWSWDINIKLKKHQIDSLIYQNFLMLFGIEFMDEWMNRTDTKSNHFEKIKKYFSHTKYFELLNKYLLTTLSEKDKEKFNKILESKKNELDFIADKIQYFDLVKKNKMKYLKEVEKIDILLHNRPLLRNEYIKKNLKLDEKRRIPTVGTYKQMLEERRQKCIEKISLLSSSLNPNNYMNHKKELEEFVNTNSVSNITQKEIVIDMQKEFIKALKDRIFEIEDIEELKKYVYRIRYYRYFYINEKEQIKDIKELEEEIKPILKQLVQRLCYADEIKRIAIGADANQDIIYLMLDTKMIDIKDIKFELKIKDKKLKLITYEKEVFENEYELNSSLIDEGFEIKLAKVYKLFI